MTPTTLSPRLRAHARARGSADAMRKLNGDTVQPPWSVMDESLTKVRLAREWLDAFEAIVPTPGD